MLYLLIIVVSTDVISDCETASLCLFRHTFDSDICVDKMDSLERVVHSVSLEYTPSIPLTEVCQLISNSLSSSLRAKFDNCKFY